MTTLLFSLFSCFFLPQPPDDRERALKAIDAIIASYECQTVEFDVRYLTKEASTIPGWDTQTSVINGRFVARGDSSYAFYDRRQGPGGTLRFGKLRQSKKTFYIYPDSNIISENVPLAFGRTEGFLLNGYGATCAILSWERQELADTSHRFKVNFDSIDIFSFSLHLGENIGCGEFTRTWVVNKRNNELVSKTDSSYVVGDALRTEAVYFTNVRYFNTPFASRFSWDDFKGYSFR